MKTSPPPSDGSSRRQFLTSVSRGMLLSHLGLETTVGLGLFPTATHAAEPTALSFGPLEPLVTLMAETPADQLLPQLGDKLRQGTSLRQLTAAGALANARAFGGEDYIGFHTLMALGPALHMAEELPATLRALPVFKVLHRNTTRLQQRSATTPPVLNRIEAPPSETGSASAERLRDAVRSRNATSAENIFAAAVRDHPDQALENLLLTVEDETEVHRVVLPYRAWMLLDVTGHEHAHTLLRQSVRYCLQAESWKRSDRPESARSVLPRLLEEHHLLDHAPGTRPVDVAWMESTSQAIVRSSPAQAAALAAGALAEGIAPDAVGEAITLAANQLILRDFGRTPRDEAPGKPVGSVHGDSIGVHASDSANAWRHLASVAPGRHGFSCLILGAYQVALDRVARGGDFLNWEPLPLERHLAVVTSTDPAQLVMELDEAIRGNLQARASAIVHRYGAMGHPARPIFDCLLNYAVSEDGSLHAEKFYRTVSEEFATTRPAFRWRHLVALARVTASEFGRTAPGIPQAREVLGLS